jgi:dTDP-4-amino-4,6-dideoxygalactose transaminase
LARQRIADRYTAALGHAVACPPQPANLRSAWAQYTVRVDRRDAVARAMRRQGVPTMVYYPRPLHLQPAYARFGGGAGAHPASEALSREVLSLPMHPYLDAATQDRVVDTLLGAIAR